MPRQKSGRWRPSARPVSWNEWTAPGKKRSGCATPGKSLILRISLSDTHFFPFTKLPDSAEKKRGYLSYVRILVEVGSMDISTYDSCFFDILGPKIHLFKWKPKSHVTLVGERGGTACIYLPHCITKIHSC